MVERALADFVEKVHLQVVALVYGLVYAAVADRLVRTAKASPASTTNLAAERTLRAGSAVGVAGFFLVVSHKGVLSTAA